MNLKSLKELSPDKKRHICKTISYRVLAICVTMVVGYTFTKSWHVSIGITILDQLLKTLVYYSHERVWYKYIRFEKY